MNTTTLSDTEIFNIIDKEISQGDLEPTCEAIAEQESQGNYDLMISRYFLARIETLKNQQVDTTTRSSELALSPAELIEKATRSVALEERKIASANQHLVRYRVDTASAVDEAKKKKKNRKNIICVSGNMILALSSVSVISALLILLGHTVQTLPYLKIMACVAVSLATPYLFSKISIKNCIITYQSTLTAICLFTCLGSAATGFLLLKKNPPSYNPVDEKALQLTQADLEEKSVEIALKPAKSGSSVVANP